LCLSETKGLSIIPGIKDGATEVFVIVFIIVIIPLFTISGKKRYSPRTRILANSLAANSCSCF
jgi:hypothetical protein